MAGFIESVLCSQTETEKMPKSAQVDTEPVVSWSDEDTTNSLLYYLCALGIEGYDEVADLNEHIPSAATVP